MCVCVCVCRCVWAWRGMWQSEWGCRQSWLCSSPSAVPLTGSWQTLLCQRRRWIFCFFFSPFNGRLTVIEVYRCSRVIHTDYYFFNYIYIYIKQSCMQMKAPAAGSCCVQPHHAVRGGHMGQSQAVSFWAAWPVWDWIKPLAQGHLHRCEGKVPHSVHSTYNGSSVTQQGHSPGFQGGESHEGWTCILTLLVWALDESWSSELSILV